MVKDKEELITTKICMTKDVGVNSNLFGGYMVAFIDEAAATYACQVCSDPRMVTVQVDGLTFKRPVKVGQHIKFYGSIVEIGRTSVKININVKSHNVRTGTQVDVCETNIMFVRVDEFNEPLPISKDVKDRYSSYLKKESKND